MGFLVFVALDFYGLDQKVGGFAVDFRLICYLLKQKNKEKRQTNKTQ